MARALRAQAIEIDAHPAGLEAVFAAQAGGQTPRQGQLEIHDLSAALADEVVMGVGVAVVTHDAIGARYGFDLAIRDQHVEVAVDRPQGESGGIHP